MKKYKYLILISILFLSISCSKEESPVEPEAKTGGVIEGKVISAETGEGISQVLVTTANSSSSTTTEFDGSYRIENVASGNFKITASKSGYYSSELSVKVDSGKVTRGDFVLQKQKYGTIYGTIIDVVSNQPIQGVTVATDPVSGIVNTSATGQYKLENIIILKNQTYKVTASKSDLYDVVTKSVTFGDSTEINVSFSMDPQYGSIEGNVTDSKTLLPVAGVSISTNPATSSVLTNAQGYYKIENVKKLTGATAKYTITAEKSGYVKNSSISVVVLGGKVTKGDIILTPTP